MSPPLPRANLPPASLLTTHKFTNISKFLHLASTDTTKPYILFTDVPQIVVDSLIESSVLDNDIKIHYNSISEDLLLKVPTQPTNLAQELFAAEIRKQAGSFLLNSNPVAVIAQGVINQPDLCSHPPGRSNPWPSVVVLTGYQAGMGYLREEAQWWLTTSRMEVRKVVLICLGRHKIRMEQWAPCGLVKYLEVVVAGRGETEMSVRGEELSLRTTDLFRRHLVMPWGVKLSFDGEFLKDMAGGVWGCEWPDGLLD